MMEPPPPLKIKGTARTNITMSNSESYFYNSMIEADRWGAVSTDATGGHVYVETNGCKIVVHKSGYGAYSDFGGHVVINRGTMDVATYGAVIAGAAEVRMTDVTGISHGNAQMIHSVMGNPAEVGKCRLTRGSWKTAEAVVLVKSANADVVIDHAQLYPANGVLLETVVNDDPNATRVGNSQPPGNRFVLRNGQYAGDVVHGDVARTSTLHLEDARLSVGIYLADLMLDAKSRWMGTRNSRVILRGVTDTSRIDAPRGVMIMAVAGEGTTLSGSITLKSGGTLKFVPTTAALGNTPQ